LKMGADTGHVEMCELAIRHAGVGTAQREEKAKAVAPVNQPTKSWRGKGIQKVANTPDAPGVMEAPRVRLEDPLHGGTVSIPPGSLFRCSRVYRSIISRHYSEHLERGGPRTMVMGWMRLRRSSGG